MPMGHPPWAAGEAGKAAGIDLSLREGSQGQGIAFFCAQRQLLCHLLRGSGLAEVQAAGEPKGESLVLSPAEIHTFTVVAVPSQPGSLGSSQPQGGCQPGLAVHSPRWG